MGACAFCGPTDDEITKEHVWPVWISDALEVVMVGDTVHHRRFDGDAVVKEWQAGEINLQVRALCKPCNRDWLGGFEGTVVKPLLVKPILYGSSVTLTCIEQATVSAWACKMAMVYELANPGKPAFFTTRDRKAFRDSTKALPELEVRLAVYNFNDRRIGHCYSGCHELTENFGDRRRLQLFFTTMSAGHLVMQLVAVREKDTGVLLPATAVEVDYSPEAAASFAQVWPSRRPRVTWRWLDEEGLLRISKMWDLEQPTTARAGGGS